MKFGVTEEQMGGWESAWRMVVSLEWPEGLEMERDLFPDDHLGSHIHQTDERGMTLRASTWTRFYISDRVDQIRHAQARLAQEARMAEDPAEREARQNRHLPPDRSNEFPAPTQAGVQQ